MRSLVFLIIMTFSLGAHADSKVESMLRYYDDSETQVISPHVKARGKVYNDNIEIGAGYAMDVVSSSSCDVRSWASQPRINDLRKEIGIDGNLTLSNGNLSLGYVGSEENDYDSQIYSVGLSREFFDKNTTATLGFAYGNDHVKSSEDRGFKVLVKHSTMSASITQILNRKSLYQLLYDFKIEEGYLSSPYRVARIYQLDGSVLGMPESTPLTRSRHSGTVRYNYFYEPFLISTSSAVRIYTDNWGVKSVALEEQLSREITRELLITVNSRYYQQSQADFYRDKYDLYTQSPFMTGNKTLASLWSMLIGISPTYKLGKGWEVYGRVEYYLMRYFNFTDVGVPTTASDDKIYSLSSTVYGFGLSATF